MITNVFIIFAAITSTIALECNPESCGGKEQTLCKYPSPDPASSCGEVNSATLTQEEKDEIVKAHNDRRALVASGEEKRGNPGPQPAGQIPPLEWSDEIAEVAQRWANQCNFGHDECRNLDQSIGQNVGLVWDPSGYNSKLTDLVESWYNEVQNFDGSKVGKFEWQETPAIGHYTQLVWGATTQVGCGLTKYLTDNSYHTYLVCDYGPTGNFIGQPVYQTS
ncbi:venom allergen 5-like [Microplitis mediator]|uniref:venom allergen 5-like n=1 Tax=Microplitis mediator TaxID=375433 RepID=UPI002555B0A6|nr:venom allergen 5-like [Microplitis mediator]